MTEASAPPEAEIGAIARCEICWHGHAEHQLMAAHRVKRTFRLDDCARAEVEMRSGLAALVFHNVLGY
jgi:hypothetical protein